MGTGGREDIQWVQDTGDGEVPRPAYRSVLGDLHTIEDPAIADWWLLSKTLAVVEFRQRPWAGDKVQHCSRQFLVELALRRISLGWVFK